MKKHTIVLLAAAAVCVLGAGCTSLSRDHARVLSTTVFSCDHERIWLLTIETRKSEQFRLVGRQFELWGSTGETRAGNSKRFVASVWLVGSQISYGEHNYFKMVAEGSGSTVSAMREGGKDDKLSGVVEVTLPDAPVIQPLNRPLVVGKTGDQYMRLTVGPAVYERSAVGTANGSQPFHSEPDSTSSAVVSSR